MTLGLHRPGRRVCAFGIAALLAAGTAAAVTHSAADAAPAVHYAVNRSLCAEPAQPGNFRCFAMERVEVKAGTRGAYAYHPDATFGHGHIGGYSPKDLAQAYRYSSGTPVTQTVGIVDWNDDPMARKDLDIFDHAYGLRKETATSFRKVNQNGQAAPLPAPSKSSSPEIALDIEAVRAVCHRCRILLVEASKPTNADIATAENTAARLGADEISNSFGTPESTAKSPTLLAAFHHPGIVITASTGDDGWYGWDFPNSGDFNDGEAQFPSTDPDVVAVGGTELTLNPDGTRKSETVWNENGIDNHFGDARGAAGATGGGCSKLYVAKSWQTHVANYGSSGCGSKRLATDISAIADPQRGFDVVDSYGHGSNSHHGWLTIGGTSLSAPVTAALFALAGGSGGSAWPAASLYINSALHPSARHDVVAAGDGSAHASIGGSAYCGGDGSVACMNHVLALSDGDTNNPNGLLDSPVDCSYPRSGHSVGAPPPLSRECNAMTGYDGPSGIGTPKGLGLFHHTSPAAYISQPSAPKHRVAATFTAHVHESIAGAHATTYAWKWGDGKTSSTTTAGIAHTYAKGGAYTVTVTISDSLHQVVIRKTKVTVH